MGINLADGNQETDKSEQALREQEESDMPETIRVTPMDARQKVTSGAALLVCAYDDEQKFQQFHLEGALSFTQFQSRLPSLQKGGEIIFYCA